VIFFITISYEKESKRRRHSHCLIEDKRKGEKGNPFSPCTDIIPHFALLSSKKLSWLTISVILHFNDIVDVPEKAVDNDVQDEGDDDGDAKPIGVVHGSLLL
jgi:hypothetical protein